MVTAGNCCDHNQPARVSVMPWPQDSAKQRYLPMATRVPLQVVNGEVEEEARTPLFKVLRSGKRIITTTLKKASRVAASPRAVKGAPAARVRPSEVLISWCDTPQSMAGCAQASLQSLGLLHHSRKKSPSQLWVKRRAQPRKIQLMMYWRSLLMMPRLQQRNSASPWRYVTCVTEVCWLFILKCLTPLLVCLQGASKVHEEISTAEQLHASGTASNPFDNPQPAAASSPAVVTTDYVLKVEHGICYLEPAISTAAWDHCLQWWCDCCVGSSTCPLREHRQWCLRGG